MLLDDLIVGTGVDLEGVTRGMRSAVAVVERGSRDLDRIAASSATAVNASLQRIGTQSARDPLRGIKESVRELARMAGDLGGGRASSGDAQALNALIAEQRDVARATAGAGDQVLALSEALRVMGDAAVSGTSGLRSVEQILANVERTAQRVRQAPALGATLVGSSNEAAAAAAQAERQAQLVTRAAEQERAARATARQELAGDIRQLGLYARAVDTRSVAAVRAWREEAAAIQRQARELNVSREQMLRLEATIAQVERRFQAADRTAQRMAAQTARINAGGLGPLVAETGRFTDRGQRAANAAIALAFALENVARGGTAADAGVRTALRSVASFAALFGPSGLIVSGVAASTAAIVDLFSRARDEARRTREQFQTDIEQMARTGDNLDLQTKLQDLLEGDRGKGDSPFGGYIDGLRDLEGRIASARRALDVIEPGTTARRFRAAVSGQFGAAIMDPLTTGVQEGIDELEGKLATLREQRAKLEQLIQNPPTPQRRPTGLPTVEITVLSPEQAARKAREARERLERAFRESVESAALRVQILPQLDAPLDVQLQAVDRLRERLAAVTTEIARQGGPLEANTADLQLQIRAVEALDQRYRRLALAPPPGGFTAAPDGLVRGYDAATDRARGYAAVVSLAVERTERLADILAQLTGAGRGLVAIGRSAGRLSDDMTDVLDGVLGVVEGFELLKRAQAAAEQRVLEDPFEIPTNLDKLLQNGPGLVAVLGGVAGILGGLLNRGPSPVEIALKSNEEELARVRAELRDVRGTFAQLDVGSDAARAIATRRLDLDQWLPGGGIIADRALLDLELAKLGTTFADLSALADRYGIDLTDSKDRILLPAFQQLAEALDLARQAALRWQNDLAGIQSQQDLYNRVFDIAETPLQALKDSAEQFRRLSLDSGLYEQIFGGIDLASESGRALLEQRTRDFVERLLAGDISLQELIEQSGFENIEELTQWLLGADDALDKFTEATNAATAALTNVPAGFKLNLRRFESTMAAVERAVPVAPASPELYPGARPALPTGTSVSGGAVHYHVQSLTVDAKDRTAREMFEEIRQELHREARSLDGGALTPPHTAWNN